MDLGNFFMDAQFPQVKQKDWMAEKNLELVTEDTLKRVIDACIDSGLYALDIETTGLNFNVERGETVDKIVGLCLSPDGHNGYYLPLRHRSEEGEHHPANLPFHRVHGEVLRLVKSGARAIFHNGKFDTAFLQHNGQSEPWGEWDDPKLWEDTMILAYLRNTRARQKNLKYLSKEDLGMEMIELKELFPVRKRRGPLDFSTLDPTKPEVIWYAASDAICTYLLFQKLSKEVLEDPKHKQSFIYKMEKLCVAATRWMERNGIYIDREKVKELSTSGHKDLQTAILTLYSSLEAEMGRDVMPHHLKILMENFTVDDPDFPFSAQLDWAKRRASKDRPKITNSDGREVSEFYDVFSAKQLGGLLQELNVPGLKFTEASKQVDTSRAAMEELLKRTGGQFSYMNNIRKLREVNKALSTYLIPLWTDVTERGTLHVNYNAHKVDTGRFSTPKSRAGAGGTSFFLQGVPAGYVKDRPECMLRLRECISCRPNSNGMPKFFVGIDYSGVELRISTNLSGEPLWKNEYFRCSDCGKEFDRGDGKGTPIAPPDFCPNCGGDKIGDLHSLTAINVYGEEAKGTKEWKSLRNLAKGANFALSYGGTGNAVMRSTGCSKQEGWRIKNQFDASYTVLKRWWNKTQGFARKNSYVLSAFGRKYPLPDITHEEKFWRSKAERNALNAPIQSTSADITKLAMGLIYKECKKRNWLDKCMMVVTMHDELCFEIDADILEEAVEMIDTVMSRNAGVLALKWPVPLTTDTEVGYNWTVPWHYNQMKHDGKWCEELAPYIKSKRVEYQAPEKKKTDIPQTGPTMDAGGVFKYPLGKPLSIGLMEKLAAALSYSQGTGDRVLRVQTQEGKLLAWPCGEVKVSQQVFLRAMGEAPVVSETAENAGDQNA